MNAELTFRKVSAAVAGVLFLIVGGLLVVGFGGLGQYGFGLRIVLALLIATYGVIRIRGAFRKGPEES